MTRFTRNVALLALSSIGGLACGGDACQTALDHLEECGLIVDETENPTVPPTMGTSKPVAAAKVNCNGEAECDATCVNRASCDALSGKDKAGNKAYEACLAKCEKK